MPDPMSNDEVEDILSSIRRLVSDEKKPTKSVQSDKAAPVDRLVLTPALRVSDDTEAGLSDAASHEDKAGDEAGDTEPAEDAQTDPLTLRAEHEAEDDPRTQSVADESADAETTRAAIADWSDADEGIWDAENVLEGVDAAADFEDEAPFAEDVDADDWSAFEEDSAATGSVTRLTEAEVPLDNDVLEAEEVFDDEPADDGEPIDSFVPAESDDRDDWDDGDDAAEHAGPAVLSLVPGQDNGRDDGTDEDGPYLDADPVAAMTAADTPLVFQHHDAATSADAMIEAEAETEEVRADSLAEAWGGSDLTEKVAALETLVARRQTQDDWEPDGAGDGDYAGTDAPHIAWEDTVPETHTGTDPDRTEAGTATDAAPPDLTQSEEAFLDETVLRELISDIVREELQGAMGERITRNVRKLVRREIHRALAAQDLD